MHGDSLDASANPSASAHSPRRSRRLALLAALLATASMAQAQERPEIVTSDVTRFYQVYEAAGGHPTADQLDHGYLAEGSPSLHEFAKLRNVTGARIAAEIAAHPEIYVGARRCLSVLPEVKQRLTAAFAKLAALYPEAKFPPVTIVVGRGKPVGITNPSGVTMGLEALCAADFMDPDVADRFVHTIAHEYGHIQQPEALQALNPGDPGATVLRMSLMEGTGEFIAELISGGVAEYRHKAWTKEKKLEIETRFVRDEDKTDLSAWMYNGPGTPDKPGDLGYWVGYRIVKAYYARARDKHQALRDIFELKDPKRLVAESGWKPGV